MNYWIVKTEPDTYSIDDLKKDKITHWHGVRNYQARNYLRDMKVGDQLFIYHSGTDPVGIAGLAKVVKEAYPDPSQFDKKGDYYDPKATADNPRWFCPDIKFQSRYEKVLSLSEIKKIKGLSKMVLLKRGNRLSVMPVSEEEFKILSAIC